MTQPKKSPTPNEEPLKGDTLKERAQELEVEGRSSMSADELREAVAEEEKEGAPKTETPEEKDEVPEESPRDEGAPLETPEAPREVTQFVDSRAIAAAVVEAALEHAGAKPPKNPPSQAAATVSDSYVVDLYKHVADNPVDSHAPTWVARTPNTTGGYS